MIRWLLIAAVLFALPFLAWGLWRFTMARARMAGGGAAPPAPWASLSLIGLIAALISALALIGNDSGAPGGVYVPPHLDAAGRVLPAEMNGPAGPRDGG